jgi:hypothetical protein
MSNPLILNSFANISQKASYIAQIIKNEQDAENIQCYLHCEFIDNKHTVRIGTIGDIHVWTYLPIYDRKSGPPLAKTISVNLYDFQSILETCRDDVIAITLDEYEGGVDLVISSYYNDDNEWYELVVKQHAEYVDVVPSIEINTPKQAECFISSLASYTISNYFNALQLDKIMVDLQISDLSVKTKSVFDMKISGTSYFENGNESMSLSLMPKDSVMHMCLKDKISFDLPISLFILMTSTGQITDVGVSILEDGSAYCKTSDYGFHYPNSESNRNPISIQEASFDGIIMHSNIAKVTLNTLSSINKASSNQIMKIEKKSDATADVSVENGDRLWVCVRAMCATFNDNIFETSLMAVNRIFTISNCDALKVKHNNEGISTIFYETGWCKIQSRFHKDFGSTKKEII